MLTSLLLLLSLETRTWARDTPSPPVDSKHIFGGTPISQLPRGWDQDFFNFVTRPDIRAPRWDVTRLQHRSSLAPGYWFTPTYTYIDGDKSGMHISASPNIYDHDGELIWSGGEVFNGNNVKDFKVSNIDGVDRLTAVYTLNNAIAILNDGYEVLQVVTPPRVGSVNLHDFALADNETKALILTSDRSLVPDEEIAEVGCQGEQFVHWPGFEERDIDTWAVTSQWNARGHIRANETLVEVDCERAAWDTWDAFEANSVDKFPDGSYLLSLRHSDALYKISGVNGSILWRFGGKHSDFMFDLHFPGQNDARVCEQNETHTLLSVMDTTIRPGEADSSRDSPQGMTILLNTASSPMAAQVVSNFDHSHHIHGRGNMQPLDGGNTLLSWWDRSLIAEHSATGELLMNASWSAQIEHSYRSYKFPWTGRPRTPPDAYAWATEVKKRTEVYASWNGATEVAQWKVYEVKGDKMHPIGTQKRQGFETKMTYEGIIIPRVVVFALDAKGDVLGQSASVDTVVRPNARVPHFAPLPIAAMPPIEPTPPTTPTPAIASAPAPPISEASVPTPPTSEAPVRQERESSINPYMWVVFGAMSSTILIVFGLRSVRGHQLVIPWKSGDEKDSLLQAADEP